MARRTKAQLAAAKGWVTRRANAARKARSEAARKGWAARQAKAAKRSEAARKGWESRRAKAAPEPEQSYFDPDRKRRVRWYETEEIERVGGEKKYKTKGGGK